MAQSGEPDAVPLDLGTVGDQELGDTDVTSISFDACSEVTDVNGKLSSLLSHLSSRPSLHTLNMDRAVRHRGHRNFRIVALSLLNPAHLDRSARDNSRRIQRNDAASGAQHVADSVGSVWEFNRWTKFSGNL
jgi:hypothetical protein